MLWGMDIFIVLFVPNAIYVALRSCNQMTNSVLTVAVGSVAVLRYFVECSIVVVRFVVVC